MKKTNDFWSLFVAMLSFLVFLTITILLLTKNAGLKNFDTATTVFFSKNRVKFFDYLFVIISLLGEKKTLVVLCIILLILPNRREVGIPVTFLTLVSFAINFAIKISVMRARPEGYFLTENILGYTMPTSYSFPSGHAQTANLFYFSLTMISLKYFDKSFIRIMMSSFIILFCLLMNIARVYLGVHFLSDVIAGTSLAICILLASIFVYGKANKCSLNIY